MRFLRPAVENVITACGIVTYLRQLSTIFVFQVENVITACGIVTLNNNVEYSNSSR